MNVRGDTYKGKPIIIFEDNGRFVLSMGLYKAMIVLEHIEDIKKFVKRFADD
jgi:hypothetical protein